MTVSHVMKKKENIRNVWILNKLQGREVVSKSTLGHDKEEKKLWIIHLVMVVVSTVIDKHQTNQTKQGQRQVVNLLSKDQESYFTNFLNPVKTLTLKSINFKLRSKF